MKHPEYEEFGFEWVDEMYPTNEEEDENMSECAKRGCSYYWQDEDEAYPRCHYDDPMFPAPCDQDEDDPYEDWDEDFYVEEEDGCSESADDLELGFDPYEGCYTWDC